ncbi:DUF4270 family protein [Marinilabilia rubra]|uniref:DUF4270 domain-containing protein n=1 Tax=Marinilabilia rubra TaxID=2162893 RepID=A0A2U2BB20_9BACT|nr:DUF4270 family protein [Marinilabilia rubra]PWE00260.1 hypothetical protein DDZ16_04780 [Marinilabilia rubra]
MLKKRSLRQFVPIIVAAFAFFASCKDETGTLGLDVLPSDDLFSGTNTESHLPAQNENPVRVRTDDVRFAKIGTVTDPYGGTTKASIVTEVTLETTNFGKLNKSDNQYNYTVDSLVLNLSFYKGWWFGDTTAYHNLQVYQLNTPLSPSQKYYSDFSVDGLLPEEPLGEKLGYARDTVPFINQSETIYVPQFQIKLDHQLAEEIFNFEEDTMTDRETFRGAFNPLYITSELVDTETRGSLIALDLLANSTNMTLHYSRESLEEDTTVALDYTFPINIECLRINRFEHDNTNTIDIGNTEADHLIAQGMAGSLVKIDFNNVEFVDENGQSHYLFDFWESKSADGEEDQFYGVSAVDVFFETDTLLYQQDEKFISSAPDKLNLFKLNEDNELEVPFYKPIPDDPNTWVSFFIGGFRNKDTQEYQFRMEKEIFEMMVEQPELRGPYYLSIANPENYEFNVFPWRAILLNNQTGEPNTPRFRIKYVKIQN